MGACTARSLSPSICATSLATEEASGVVPGAGPRRPPADGRHSHAWASPRPRASLLGALVARRPGHVVAQAGQCPGKGGNLTFVKAGTQPAVKGRDRLEEAEEGRFTRLGE